MRVALVFRIFVCFLLAQIAMAGSVQADLRIEVTQGVDNAVRVAVVPFDYRVRGSLPVNVHEVVDSDLTLSGRFETLPANQMLSLPHQSEDVFFRDWRLLNVEYLVLGYMERVEFGYRLTFELYSVFKQTSVAKQTIEGTEAELRDMAHHISDVVYEELTGIPGAFSSRIMYVTASGPVEQREYRLTIADADGYRPETVLISDEPILSASWSPDGNRIAYVSFENGGRPAIYIRDLQTNRKQQITSFAGLNGAPAFSPDRQKARYGAFERW